MRPQATPRKNKDVGTHGSQLVGLSSLYYYVTRSHHLHLVHHKWTDVIMEGVTGPLDSLLRLNQVVGESRVGAQDGDRHSLHTRTHTEIYLWSLILYILYIENIYIYTIHRQLRCRRAGTPRQGLWAPGDGECHIKGQCWEMAGPAHPPTNSWEGCSPFLLLRGSKGLGPRLGALKG